MVHALDMGGLEAPAVGADQLQPLVLGQQLAAEEERRTRLLAHVPEEDPARVREGRPAVEARAVLAATLLVAASPPEERLRLRPAEVATILRPYVAPRLLDQLRAVVPLALYLLNQKRSTVITIEQRYRMSVMLEAARVLKQLNIGWEINALVAYEYAIEHRTPDSTHTLGTVTSIGRAKGLSTACRTACRCVRSASLAGGSSPQSSCSSFSRKERRVFSSVPLRKRST